MGQTSSPDISVVMPVYNGARYLESALRSIMVQTHENIEIIVIDDASTDDTGILLERLAEEDPRLRVLSLSKNSGSAGATNAALGQVRAPYVARMDADDIAHPDRLARQKAYLDAHPDVMLVASSVEQIDARGCVQRISARARDRFMSAWFGRFQMPFVHPTMMFRTTGAMRYDPAFEMAEDYDLAARAGELGETVALPDMLVQYRNHGEQITARKFRAQNEVAGRIARRAQAAQYPREVQAALEPFNRALFGFDHVPPKAVFAGLRRAIAHDARHAPRYRRWMMQHGAQMLLTALGRSGLSKPAALGAFLTAGPDFLLPLVFRFLETRSMLPRWLKTEPDL